MFTLTKKVDLSSFGWEGCVLEFTSPSYGEMTQWQKKLSKNEKELELSSEITEMVKSKFVQGTGMDGDKKVPVTKDNFDELPFEIVLECITQISGGKPDPNS